MVKISLVVVSRAIVIVRVSTASVFVVVDTEVDNEVDVKVAVEIDVETDVEVIVLYES